MGFPVLALLSRFSKLKYSSTSPGINVEVSQEKLPESSTPDRMMVPAATLEEKVSFNSVSLPAPEFESAPLNLRSELIQPLSVKYTTVFAAISSSATIVKVSASGSPLVRLSVKPMIARPPAVTAASV